MSTSLITTSNIIGENADLATCCQSSKINPWSFNKPINSNKMTSLTTQDYYDANDGFDLGTVSTPRTFSTPQQMLYELQHPIASNIWKYTARTAPFRLTDFNNYDHYAPKLCELYFVGDNSGEANSIVELTCDGLIDMIRHWAYFEGVRSYVDLIFLIYRYGTEYDQSGTQGVYIYKYCSVMDYMEDHGTFDLRIPRDLTTGNYEIRLACSVNTGLSDDKFTYVNQNNPLPGAATFYALPQHCKQTLQVTSSGGGGGGGGGGGSTSTDYYNYLTIDFYNAHYTYNNYIISDLSFTNYIVIGSSVNKTLDIYVEYWFDEHYDPTYGLSAGALKLGYAHRILNEEDIPWATINMQYGGNINTIADAYQDRIPIVADFSLTVDGTAQRKQMLVRIDRV